MKRIPVFIFLLLVSFHINAQEIIATQGDSYSNSSGSVDFTIGEPITDTYQNSNSVLSQGFQQSRLTVTIVESLTEDIDIAVNPNPVNSFLNITVPNLKQNYLVEIYDINSKNIFQQKITDINSTIDFSGYTCGTYIILFKDHKNIVVKTFKIQKTH